MLSDIEIAESCKMQPITRVAAKLGLKEGQTTTPDLKFTLETVACIGACGLAPVFMVNDDTHGRLTPESVGPILDKYA